MFIYSLIKTNNIIFKSAKFDDSQFESAIKLMEQTLINAHETTGSLSSFTTKDENDNTIIIPKALLINSIIKFEKIK